MILTHKCCYVPYCYKDTSGQKQCLASHRVCLRPPFCEGMECKHSGPQWVLWASSRFFVSVRRMYNPLLSTGVGGRGTHDAFLSGYFSLDVAQAQSSTSARVSARLTRLCSTILKSPSQDVVSGEGVRTSTTVAAGTGGESESVSSFCKGTSDCSSSSSSTASLSSETSCTCVSSKACFVLREGTAFTAERDILQIWCTCVVGAGLEATRRCFAGGNSRLSAAFRFEPPDGFAKVVWLKSFPYFFAILLSSPWSLSSHVGYILSGAILLYILQRLNIMW